ncbi:bifunctional glycosyltransferase family 2 protein/class I SAM-dependent methyltransferase [Marinisporobacter balticus]|uniref:GT2 family glycosyltransferase n=1 Tax=Marinisporobacter balticus TaxID=2018667 RepID=A0A4V2SB01_9FIRM|nr:bifunctional glycosyltransferase family 2 protein/class I SAM-dependent methyltransferase [Marinisporobacter balticus]TCO73640.1 GT2 family glycosyltransferase [Marinisporobacter balticus]
MKTSIIILTFNQLHYTKLCIDSIRKYTEKDTYEIIVVDNHSTDETVQWLKNQEDIKTILNKENLGFPKGCNQGIKIAQGDNILLLNNDVIVTPNWLSNLNKCLYSSDDIGAVGAVTNYCSNYQTIKGAYKNTEEMIDFAKKNNLSNKDEWEERLKLIGFCMLIKKNVLEKVGTLDEIFSPGNFEDDDYSFRIRKAGYKLMLCKDVFIYHFGSISFNENRNKFSEIFTVNKKKFEEKWGFSTSYYSDIQVDLINLIDHFQFEKINVLEIGCGFGSTLLQIKNVYKNAGLYGIELNKKTLEITRAFADIQCIDIEKEDPPYAEEFFDYILLGNTLEHLYDPLNVLKNIRKYLKKEGKILMSISNVIHYNIIRNLLNGDWRPVHHFLKTPIRFFTINEIDTMLKTAKYSIEIVTGKITQQHEDDKQFINSLNQIIGKDMTSQYKYCEYYIKSKKFESASGENTEIKFLLRRIENDILVEESITCLIEMLHKCKLDLYTIMKLIDVAIIKKEKVFNQLAAQLYKKSMYEYANVLLAKSYEMNPQHMETQKLLKCMEGEHPC